MYTRCSYGYGPGRHVILIQIQTYEHHLINRMINDLINQAY